MNREELQRELELKHLEAKYKGLLEGKSTRRLFFEQRLSEIAHRRTRRLRIVAAIKALGQVMLYIGAYILLEGLLVWIMGYWFAPGLTEQSSPIPSRFILCAARFTAISLITYTFCRFWDKTDLLGLGLRWQVDCTLKKVTSGVWLGSLLAIALLLVTLVASEIAVTNGFAWQSSSFILVLLSTANSGIAITSVVVAEELMYRGYIQQVMQRGWGQVGAAVISALLYTLLYSGSVVVSPVGYLAIFLKGLLLCRVYLSAGDLWVPIGVHWGWDFFLSVLFSLPTNGLQSDGLVPTQIRQFNIFTAGGALGPEGSIMGAIVFLCALLVFPLYARRVRSLAVF